MESKESADIDGTGAVKDEESMPESSKYHQHRSQNPLKINEKSGLGRGRVLGAFLEGLGAPKRHTVIYSPTNLVTIFHQKSKKWDPKKHPKFAPGPKAPGEAC